MISKFRAWDKENKIMLVVNNICNLFWESKFIEGYEVVPDPKGKHEYELIDRRIDLEDAILMQSTGLFDDSTPKKEIFEGDIVETIYNGELFTGVIVYDQEETGFKATNGRNEYGNNFCYLGGNDSIIVIGNIYQNPELLKEVGNDTDV